MPVAEIRHHRSLLRGALALVVFAVCLLARPAFAEPNDVSTEALQRAVDNLRSRLGIVRTVTVSVVPSNRQLLSVAPPSDPDQAFQLEIEADFLTALTDDELTAALAHELGHVWIATHRPFLQTERLANDVAMRVVTRSSLARVYRKMSTHAGLVADEDTFLGPEILKVTRHYPID